MIDCGDIERALLEGRTVNGELSGHLAECESCRFLIGDGAPVARALAGATLQPAAPDLAAMEAALGADLAAERGLLGRLRELSRPSRTLLFAAAAAAVALAYYFFLRRPDWDAYPAWRMGAVVAGYAGLALGLAWLSLRPLYVQPLSPAALVAAGLAAPLAFALLPGLPEPAHPDLRPAAGALICFAIGAAVALVIYVAARAMHRGGGAFAMPAAVAAGLIGVLAGQLECPNNHLHHLLLGHATIPFAILAATMLSRRFAAGSPARPTA